METDSQNSKVIDIASLPTHQNICGEIIEITSASDAPQGTLAMARMINASVPHLHRQTTETYLFLKGNGVVVIDGVSSAFSANQAVLIRPGQVHAVIPEEGQEILLAVFSTPAWSLDDEYPVAESI